MSILAWIILGLIAGFIASKIVGGSGQGLLLDIVLGIVGAGWRLPLQCDRRHGHHGPGWTTERPLPR